MYPPPQRLGKNDSEMHRKAVEKSQKSQTGDRSTVWEKSNIFVGEPESDQKLQQAFTCQHRRVSKTWDLEKKKKDFQNVVTVL